MNDPVPACCRNCRHLDSDSIDEYHPPEVFCLRNQALPTKKLSCKAQNPWPAQQPRQSDGGQDE